MSKPSDWPLSKDAVRIIVPAALRPKLENHALAKGVFPLALGYYPRAHRHAMQRREHDDYLLMYCLDGEGRVSTAGQSVSIHSGQIILLRPGQAHEYHALAENPWSLFWFHYAGTDAPEFARVLLPSTGSPALKQSGDLHLQSLFRSLMATVTSGYSLQAFVHAGNQIRELLSYLLWLGSQQTQRESLDSLARVSAFMRQNLHRTLSLEELAESSGLSKYYFTRRYKSVTGHSPMQHFTHMKMEQACLLLEGRAPNIAEIAFQLGYEDALYFSRVFSKVVGVSPSEYRRRVGGHGAAV